MSFLFISILLFCISLVLSEQHSFNGTVYFDSKTQQYSVRLGIMDCVNGIACGYFNDSMNITGWGVLEIKTDATSGPKVGITDVNRMYAAGLLEGYLSSYEIWWTYYTQWANSLSLEPYVAGLTNWTEQQRAWMETNINSNSASSDYWRYVELLTAQFDGQKYGYNMAAQKFGLPLLQDNFIWQWLSGLAEFGDIVNVLNPSSRPNFKEMTTEELQDYVMHRSHCSVIVKVTPLLDDIFFAHSTWSAYYTMNRIYKQYIFDLELKTASVQMSFSSYPGSLSSIDDFYIMDSGLAVVETTNMIFNNSLWDRLIPQTLFTWQRVRIANALATTAPDWTQIYQRHNSGTYNNQWIVLDSNLFKPNEPLNGNLLWILEQIPGNCSSRDVTEVLERGYWASYNVPAIPYIYKISGNAEAAEMHGTSWSYDLAPRARIFRRDANDANNLTTIAQLMRYNDYLHDPLSDGYPGWAIMSRFDLNTSNPQAFGGIDTKLANLDMLQAVVALARAGPTDDDVPNFSWVGIFDEIVHTALPITYNFKWVEMKSKLV